MPLIYFCALAALRRPAHVCANELNEAQGQPAFAKNYRAMPCRLDFFVGPYLFISNYPCFIWSNWVNTNNLKPL